MSKIPFRVSPMLATLVDQPFSKKNWVFEEKYDGIRMLAYKDAQKTSLISRNRIDRTLRYPHIANELSKLEADTLLLDGEIVIFDANHVSQFQLLQQSKGTPHYAVFDCLFADGRDLRREPLSVRRKTLERFVTSGSVIQIAGRLADDGIAAFRVAMRRGLEGVVGKNSSAVYTEGRSNAWLKVKIQQKEEFVVGGFTAPEGNRLHFGALLLGEFHNHKLQYVGKVGTGFNDEILDLLHHKMKRLAQKASPFASAVNEKSTTYVSPQLVAQVSFTERTKSGKLRHPVYLGLRGDKTSREVNR